jgi:hypothetical protein
MANDVLPRNRRIGGTEFPCQAEDRHVLGLLVVVNAGGVGVDELDPYGLSVHASIAIPECRPRVVHSVALMDQLDRVSVDVDKVVDAGDVACVREGAQRRANTVPTGLMQHEKRIVLRGHGIAIGRLDPVRFAVEHELSASH